MAHFDPSDDFSRLIDRLEPVRLLRRGGDEESLVALRQPAAGQDDAELAWRLPAADLRSAPCAGDTILDAVGVRHNICTVEAEALGTRWRCTTRAAAEGGGTSPVGLLQAICQRWAAAGALMALLPAARLYCETAADGGLPSAVVSQENCKPLMRYGDGARVDEAAVRIVITAASSGEATAIATEAILALDRGGFTFAGGRALDMRLVGEGRQRLGEGLFCVTLDFYCTVLLV